MTAIVWVDGWGSRRHIQDPEQPRRGLCGASATNSPHPKRPPCQRCSKMAGLVGPEPLDSQIARLARFIMAEVPGEPSQDQGAVDTAIRVMATHLGVDYEEYLRASAAGSE